MLTDPLSPALRGLDPGERALLELSFLRGVSDEEIAALLGVPPKEVHRRREEGIERLSDSLGLRGATEREDLSARLRSMSSSAWDASRELPTGAGHALAGTPAADRPEWEAGSDWRRTVLFAGIGFVVAALVAAGLLGSGGVDGDRSPQGRDRGGPAPTRAQRTANGLRVRMRPVARARGRGTVELQKEGKRERLIVSARGLRRPGAGAYVVWLYRALDDARAIGTFRSGSFRLSTQLPEDAAHFPALDISLEARDANQAHGGESVLRVPLVSLRGGN